MRDVIHLEELEFRNPRAVDATPIWHLIEKIGGLERNTSYAYLLLCSHFAGGSLVATYNENPVGFVLGYRVPSAKDTMFVWQVGVAPELRGQGLAGALLSRFVELPEYRTCRFLEATVAPGNEASQALFQGFARRRDLPCSRSAGFPSNLFPPPHDDEDLYRIGPLNR